VEPFPFLAISQVVIDTFPFAFLILAVLPEFFAPFLWVWTFSFFLACAQPPGLPVSFRFFRKTRIFFPLFPFPHCVQIPFVAELRLVNTLGRTCRVLSQTLCVFSLLFSFFQRKQPINDSALLTNLPPLANFSPTRGSFSV